MSTMNYGSTGQEVAYDIRIDDNADGTHNVYVKQNVTMGGRTLVSTKHTMMYCTTDEANAFRSYYARQKVDA